MGFPFEMPGTLSPEQQEFMDAVNSTSRKPVQLAIFYLPLNTYYLSDRNIGILQGLANDYGPWVEDWGTLKDNTNINNLFHINK